MVEDRKDKKRVPPELVCVGELCFDEDGNFCVKPDAKTCGAEFRKRLAEYILSGKEVEFKIPSKALRELTEQEKEK